ncbi:phosphoadenosine phosphosulfate reductase family protein [Cetobacterium somerae]|uniref:phosphoadenosine phosphosulfate reductase domain-containing protein n=1 Tax=Cetobacterium somerae TaxID=188913 RepID=UPI00389256AA
MNKKEWGIFWNELKNIPVILEKKTLNIKNNIDLKEIAQDLRPVFLEEKHLLKKMFDLAGDIYYQSVWCTKQGRYIIDGVPFKESVVKRINSLDDFESFREKVLEFEKTEDMIKAESEIIEKFILENRNHMNYLLNSRELDDEGHFIGAYPFIEEVSKTYSKRVNMVSFSGGKDSTVVSHLVRTALNNQSILHIFGDTTLELPLTYEYVEKFKEQNPMTPFFDERNEENNFFEMCKEIGPPSRVSAWCCSIFKTGPMGTTLSNFEEDFLTFYGVRRKESSSRSKYPKILKSTKIDKQLSIGPIIDWLDIDVWLYILTENIDFNFSYRQGFPRVGCWVCPHKGTWSEFTARIYNNTQYDKWEKFLLKFAKDIGKIDYSTYVKEEKWKLRRGGEGLERTKNTIIEKKACINEKNTYILGLNREIDDEFITLFKPFGEISISKKGNIQEMFVLNRLKEALFKIVFKNDSREIKVTLIDLKDRYLYGKITKQLNKFNTCIYCQACNSTCSFGALSVINGKYEIDEKKCVNCLNCINKFDMGCLVTSALRTKIKE